MGHKKLRHRAYPNDLWLYQHKHRVNEYSKTKNLWHKNDNQSSDHKGIRGTIFENGRSESEAITWNKDRSFRFILLREEASFLHGIDRQRNPEGTSKAGILRKLCRSNDIHQQKREGIKIHAITHYNETLFPVEVRIEGLEVPEGRGYLYGDAEYDSRIFLNKVVERGYLPCIKPRKIKAKGYGARIRDRIFDREKYRHRESAKVSSVL